jgi:hypothetical protein
MSGWAYCERFLCSFVFAEAAMFKLEAEYIQRCLGELTPLQESRLVQMKAWVAELLKGKVSVYIAKIPAFLKKKKRC